MTAPEPLRVALTEDERAALDPWVSGLYACDVEPVYEAVEHIIAARLAVADRDTALRERIERLAAEWKRVSAVLTGDQAEVLGDAAHDLYRVLDPAPHQQADAGLGATTEGTQQ